MSDATPSGFRAGTVALLGRPNVGKSTLLNLFVGQKVAIVSNKPQTTRRSALGIAHGPDYQIAFIDTPGVHEPHNRLGRAMVEQARQSLSGVDLVLFVADVSKGVTEDDREIVKMLNKSYATEADRPPVVLALNKMDLLKPDHVVSHVAEFEDLLKTDISMLTTASAGVNVDKLLERIVNLLPEGEPIFPDDEVTDQSSRFMAAEHVREQILNATRQEVPHAVAVHVEEWQEEEHLTRISATIIVDKSSQRAILLGKGGQFIKRIGTGARQQIEELIGKQVFLQLHVKVIEGWRQNPGLLRELEYMD